MKIKFNDTAESVVPDDALERIKRNLEIEQQAAVEKTNELKAQLSDLIAEFEREALPLIKAVGEMESLQVIPTQIDVILSHHEQLNMKVAYKPDLMAFSWELRRDTREMHTSNLRIVCPI